MGENNALQSMRENAALKAARLSLRLSQTELAAELRRAGAKSTSTRTVQRWERGETTTVRPSSARALELVTRLPIELLGFDGPAPQVSDDGHGGHDVTDDHMTINAGAGGGPGQPAQRGGYSGVWLSEYEYFSSGRGDTFTGRHYVVIIQHGDRLTVKSLPGSANSTLTMDMSIDGNVITGTWVEQTDPTGYYRGARYHGAIQLLAEPTGRRLVGKWVGFGKQMDVNTGPWELKFQDPSTSRATLDRYNRRPAPDSTP